MLDLSKIKGKKRACHVISDGFDENYFCDIEC